MVIVSLFIISHLDVLFPFLLLISNILLLLKVIILFTVLYEPLRFSSVKGILVFSFFIEDFSNNTLPLNSSSIKTPLSYKLCNCLYSNEFFKFRSELNFEYFFYFICNDGRQLRLYSVSHSQHFHISF